MAWMPNSPKGRRIEHVEGNPSDIIDRGKKITELGDQMLESAGILEDIKTRAIGGGILQGKVVEKLQETIGDSYKKLEQAGELYQPVGPVITQYGESLESVKTQIDFNADECEEKWRTFYNLPPVGESLERSYFRHRSAPEEGSPEAEQEAEEDAAKQTAHEAWETQAGSFDFWYDSWESAFDTAVDGMTDGLSDSIKDSFWSDFADIMGWVALALGVAAMIIGGPILAALAGLAAVLYLVAVIGQYTEGEAGGSDIALAALGVFPLGKLSNMTKLMHGTKGLQVFGKGALGNFGKLQGLFGKPALGSSSLVNVFKTQGAGATARQFLLGTTGLKATRADHLRAYMGAYDDLASNLGRFRNIVKLDAGLTALGQANTFNGWSDKAGGPSIKLPNWSGALI